MATFTDITRGYVVSIEDTLNGTTQRLFTKSLTEAEAKAARLIEVMKSGNIAVIELTSQGEEVVNYYQTDWQNS